MRETKWLIKKGFRAIYFTLSEKTADVSFGNSLAPFLLPVIAIFSIHTYISFMPLERKPQERTLAQIHELTGSHSLPDSAIAKIGLDRGAGNDIRKKSENIKGEGGRKTVAPDITRGELLKNELSITFDGGGEASDAEEILEILKQRNIQTTIFLTGEFIKRHPELVKKMAADGHEIGNHTRTHPHLTSFEKNFKQQTLPGVNKKFIAMELKETAGIFKELTGRDMI